MALLLRVLWSALAQFRVALEVDKPTCSDNFLTSSCMQRLQTSKQVFGNVEAKLKWITSNKESRGVRPSFSFLLDVVTF